MSDPVPVEIDEVTSPIRKKGMESDHPLFKKLFPSQLTAKQRVSIQRRLERRSIVGNPETIDGLCRLWTGGKVRGYGSISIGMGKGMSTHRASYEVTHDRELTSDIHIRHLCHNPLCTNPDHLAIGDAQDNANDRMEAGRVLIGEKHPRAKISGETAKGIGEAIKHGLKNSKIADKFGCSIKIIDKIRSGHSWSSVSGITKKVKTATKKIDLQRIDEAKAQQYVRDRIEKVMEGDHEHWNWKPKARTSGYGKAIFKAKFYYAHTFSWRAFHHCQKIPKNKCIRHGCKRKDCVNPFTLTSGIKRRTWPTKFGMELTIGV